MKVKPKPPLTVPQMIRMLVRIQNDATKAQVIMGRNEDLEKIYTYAKAAEIAAQRYNKRKPG